MPLFPYIYSMQDGHATELHHDASAVMDFSQRPHGARSERRIHVRTRPAGGAHNPIPTARAARVPADRHHVVRLLDRKEALSSKFSAPAVRPDSCVCARRIDHSLRAGNAVCRGKTLRSTTLLRLRGKRTANSRSMRIKAHLRLRKGAFTEIPIPGMTTPIRSLIGKRTGFTKACCSPHLPGGTGFEDASGRLLVHAHTAEERALPRERKFT